MKQWLLLMFSFTILLAGCTNESQQVADTPNKSSTDPTKNQSAVTVDSGKPFELSITYGFDGYDFPKEGNEVQKFIEEYTKTKLKLTVLPNNDYNDTLPAKLASGELPQVIAVSDVKAPFIIDAFRNGLFWEVGPYLKDYPNLSKVPEITYQNLSLDGKIYGLPKVRDLARWAFLYRKDWLDNLGLQEPKTLDDLYNVLRAFTFNDPDKNGKDDTLGFIASKLHRGPAQFTTYFGTPTGGGSWKEEGGRFIRDVEMDEFLQGLNYFKRLYDENILNKDFAVMDRQNYEDAFKNGKVGMILHVTAQATFMQNAIRRKDPNAELGLIGVLEGPNGPYTWTETGYNGLHVFPKSSVKTEEELRRILSFFDKLGDESMATFFEYGLEGKHHELKDGKVVLKEPELKNNEVTVPYTYRLPVNLPILGAKEAVLEPITVKALEQNQKNLEYAKSSPAVNLTSDTHSQLGSQIETILTDAQVKYVMGKIDEAGWKAAVQEWLDRGGEKIRKEYEKAYAELNRNK